MADFKMLAPYMGQLFGNIGAGLGSTNPALQNMGASVTQWGQQTARNLEYQRMLEEERKRQKAAKWGKIGSAIGSIAGTFIPGVGPVVGSALGATLGGGAGQKAGGGSFKVGDALMQYGLPSLASGAVASKLGGAGWLGKGGGPTGAEVKAGLESGLGEAESQALSKSILTPLEGSLKTASPLKIGLSSALGGQLLGGLLNRDDTGGDLSGLLFAAMLGGGLGGL